jgi:hypothetical protein
MLGAVARFGEGAAMPLIPTLIPKMVRIDTQMQEIMGSVESRNPCCRLIYGVETKKSPAPNEGAGHSQGERRLLVVRDVWIQLPRRRGRQMSSEEPTSPFFWSERALLRALRQTLDTKASGVPTSGFFRQILDCYSKS